MSHLVDAAPMRSHLRNETVLLANWRAELNRLAYDSPGDSRVLIAVLDGPVDGSHPCFAGASLKQLEAPSQTPDLAVAAAHGTSVASVIFGQPGSPVQGIVPRCHGILVPVLRQHRSALAGSQIDLARGIALALRAGAAVINISAGQFDPAGEAHPYLADMVRQSQEQGVLIVAATGNDGCCCLHVPAATASVLAVGAMDDQGNPLPMSNWGDAYNYHGILAPGIDILGAVPGGGTAMHKGTSWASAIVSGFAALLLSAQVQRGKSLDPLGIRTLLLETAVGCDELPATDCLRVMAGRLNIPRAWARLTKERMIMSDEEQICEPPTNHPDPPLIQAQGQGGDCNCGKSGGSDCTCSQKASGESSSDLMKTQPSMVYALGQLAYDFGSEARRDSLIQHGIANPYDPTQVLAHLKEHRALAAALIWTLVHDATPIYAIVPAGPFAAETYDLLRQLLQQQLEEGVERISLPGWSGGKITLSSGQVVPTVWPEIRGMYSWSTPALIEAVVGKPAKARKDDDVSERASELANFLDRIYYELRNLGILPQERAMNYAATNAFQLGEIYTRVAKAGLKLDSIVTERSPICRPESDCWDVKLTFFHPTKRLEQAREIYRLTIDVSDVVPVTVGQVRRWQVY